MASRSSADATRFTATEPHAYLQPTSVRSSVTPIPSSKTNPSTQTLSKVTKPNSKPSDSNAAPSQPPSETPKEKLARLRAARLAQRQEHLTTWERTVIRGRVWADRIHRITATSLILFSRKALLLHSCLVDRLFLRIPQILQSCLQRVNLIPPNSYSSRCNHICRNRHDSA